MIMGRRVWLTILALIALWTGLGFTHCSVSNTFIEDTYKTLLAAIAILIITFIAVYTVLGTRGAAKWWTNDIGTNLVSLLVALLVIIGPLAYADWFAHGMLTTRVFVWIYLGGYMWAALTLVWRIWVWDRTFAGDESFLRRLFRRKRAS